MDFEVLKIHKVNSKAPIILEDGVFGISVLATYDEADISTAEEMVLYFPYEEEAESIIKIINNQFEPLVLRAQEEIAS